MSYLDDFLDSDKPWKDFTGVDAPPVEDPFPEKEFQDWYSGWSETTGISPDPDDPKHKYDYRAAYKSGAEPQIADDNQYHWPSRFKADDHPNRFVAGIDTKNLMVDPIDTFLDSDEPWDEVKFSFRRLASQAARGAGMGIADVLRFKKAELEQERDIMAGTPRQFSQFWTPEDAERKRIATERLQKKQEPFRKKEIEILKDSIEKFPELIPGSSGIIEDAVAGMARFLPSMGVSAVNPIAGGAMTFSQIMGMSYDDYRKRGIDPERAYTVAMMNSLAQTPLEMAGNLLQINALKNVARSLGVSAKLGARLQRFAGALLTGIVGEGGEEFLQQFPEEISNIYLANPDLSPEEIAAEVWKRKGEITKTGLQAAKVGAVGGAILAGGVQTMAAPFDLSSYVSEKQRKITEGKTELPDLTPELIRSQFAKKEYTEKDLGAIREVWADDEKIVSAIDDILKPKKAEQYIVRESSTEGYKWDVIDTKTGDIVDQLTKEEPPAEYTIAKADKIYLPEDKELRKKALKKGVVEKPEPKKPAVPPEKPEPVISIENVDKLRALGYEDEYIYTISPENAEYIIKVGRKPPEIDTSRRPERRGSLEARDKFDREKKEKEAGQKVAQVVNKELPGNDLRYDGVQEGGEDVDFYQFTPTEGEAKDATFYTESLESEAVEKALRDKIKAFKPEEKIAKPSKKAVPAISKKKPAPPIGEELIPAIQPTEEKLGERQPTVERRREQIGRAWVKGQQKPIMIAEKLTGKEVGKVRVTLTRGRDAEGNIRPGQKVKVKESEVIEWPVEAEKEADIEITGPAKDKDVTVDIPEKEAEALSPKEQKAYLLAEIDKAIEAELEKVGFNESLEKAEKMHSTIFNPLVESTAWLTFYVPGDGEFSVAGTQLFEFKKKAKGFPTTTKFKFKPESRGMINYPAQIKKYKEKILGKKPSELQPSDIQVIFDGIENKVSDPGHFTNWLINEDVSTDVIKEIKKIHAIIPKFSLQQATTRVGDLGKLKIEDIKSLPWAKKGRVAQYQEGLFSVTYPNKRGFFIKSIDSIRDNEILFRASYGRAKKPTEKIAGTYSHENKTIRIVKGIGDKWTVTHEMYHFLKASGLLTHREVEAIGRQARGWTPNVGKYRGEEAEARWVTHELEAREKKRQSPIGKIVQKIADILDGFFNLFTQTVRGAVRAVETGKPLTRKLPSEMKSKALREGMPMFATRDQKEMLARELGFKYEKPKPGKGWKKELFGVEDKNIVDKLTDQIDDFKKNWRTRIFDRLNPIRTQLGETAYMLHRLETGVQAVLATFMRHGIPKWDGKAITVDTRHEGFLEWFKSLGKDGDNLLYWIAAKRAEQLEKEPITVKGEERVKEQWLLEPQRKQIFESVGVKPKSAESWEALHEKFNEFNDGILDLAVHAGLIDPERRKQWEQHFYVPFYRIFETAEAKEEYLRGPVQSWKNIDANIRRLMGAERKLGDPLENVIRNWTHLINESMRNMSRAEAVESAKTLDAGIIDEVDQDELTRILGSKKQTRYAVTKEGNKKATVIVDTKEEANDFVAGRPEFDISERQTQIVLFGNIDDYSIMSYQKNGERVYFRVNDPELFNAMSNTNKVDFDNLIMNLFRTSKKWLTYGATFGPGFRIANMLRDTLHTAVISKSFIPFLDSARGFAKAMREDPDFIKFAASGAAFGSSYVKADDAKVLTNFIKRVTKREGEGVTSRILDTPKKLLDMWEKIGSASENAARVSLYAKRIEQQKSHLEAAFEARDLLDFTMRGDAGAVQFLIQMVPFMNARMQGLYKLGKAAKKNPKSFFIKGGLITTASLLLWAHNRDDDRWKELEDWDKWTYYHFWVGDKHYRIPKPFEVGAIFSSFFESAAEVAMNDEEIGFFTDFIKATFGDTFAINPTPQLARPIIEQWANKSFFTGRPIESQRLQGLTPGERKEAWTSETLQLAGKWGIPPKRAEALIRGYLSTFGMFVLGMTDMVTHHLGDFPVDPAKRIDDYPMLGRFVKEARAQRNTKYSTRFYKAVRELDQLIGTINFYKRTGNMKKAREIMAKNRDELRYRTRLSRIRKSLGDINAKIRRVYQSDISPQDKRERLDNLTERRNNKTKKAYEIIMESRGKAPVVIYKRPKKKPMTLREAVRLR